ncbi:FISUMP domain-containing protein [Aequorivita sp. KMM 9714]|uniref:FISUMP domain-containing protein n=1 Tax=Aequorivita sp. KMM 9714 TaxID=2707173 RepID=UPI0013EC5878|nr:FISUMP domain-containing protein [Aequorivita sp. KMM 9714]NGX84604.1 hypothetical protein [Aequorivita sp. KMM 9714]
MKLKNLIVLLLFSNLIFLNANAQVGIGTTNPHSSAALDVSSNNSGFLPPRMTTSQRNAITNPVAGLMIYNLEENCINFWNASEWISLCGDSATTFQCGDPVTFTYKGTSVTYGTVEGANGRCWLDRNLGASRVANSKTDSNSYGDLFQWGRLDDGHQTRTSSVTSVRSNNDIPGHNKFIASQSFNDWRNPQNDALWQGLNGINNPCPNGFRLPTVDEWQTEVASWSSSNANGAFNFPLKLTIGGERYTSSGSLLGVGERGNYWSSTIITGFPKLSSKVYLSNTSVFTDAGDYRAFGASVRCIKEQ